MIKTAQQNYFKVMIEENKKDYKGISILPIVYCSGNRTHPYQKYAPY